MIRRYCDVCGDSMPDWNTGYEIEDGGIPVIIVTGILKAHRRIVYDPSNERGMKHFVDEEIDICVDCYIKILSMKRFRTVRHPIA